MSNQASEDEQAMQHICQQTGEHYYASESIPGGLIHWIRICMTCGHKDDKDLNEQVKTLVRTEKLKARLDELRYLLEDFGIEDNTQPIQKRISELTKLEAEL